MKTNNNPNPTGGVFSAPNSRPAQHDSNGLDYQYGVANGNSYEYQPLKGMFDTFPAPVFPNQGTVGDTKDNPVVRQGDDLEFVLIDELSRTYLFPNGEEVTIDGVNAISVRPSGTHRLETTDGYKFIVNSGWLAIRIEADTWSH